MHAEHCFLQVDAVFHPVIRFIHLAGAYDLSVSGFKVEIASAVFGCISLKFGVFL
jgi:hypothetical protein